MKKVLFKKLFSKTPIFLLAILMMACTGKKEEVKKVDNNDDNDSTNIELDARQQKNIDTESATSTEEISEITLNGKVTFCEDLVSKVYPLVSGNVIKVNVHLGDVVKKGQVLAILRSGDISDYQSQLDAAISSLKIAEKNRDIAYELLKTNVYSQKDVLNAENDFKKAQIAVTNLQQRLSIVGGSNESDARSVITAPVNGFVIEKNITENFEIRPDANNQIFTIGSLDRVSVIADVYEKDIAEIKEGEQVVITTLSYPDIEFTGIIKNIGSVLDPDSRVLKIRIELDNSKGLLKPEMFARVKVRVDEKKKVIKVPMSSLVFLDNKYFVVIEKKKGNYTKVEVSLIQEKDNYAYISSNIQEGQLVVRKGALLLASM